MTQPLILTLMLSVASLTGAGCGAEGARAILAPGGGGASGDATGEGPPCLDAGCRLPPWCVQVGCLTPGWRYVPAGVGWQGGIPGRTRYDHEAPVHPVRFEGALWAMETPITQQQWALLWDDTRPSRMQACGSACPVDRINWFEALATANRLSTLMGLPPCYVLEECEGTVGSGCRGEGDCPDTFSCAWVAWPDPACEGVRLPTEAEQEWMQRTGGWWEIGAAPGSSEDEVRAGCRTRETSRVSWGGGGTCPPFAEQPWPCGPEPVTDAPDNPWGLRMMPGSVFLHSWDPWDRDAYGLDPEVDPTGPREGPGLFHAVRGTGYEQTWQDCVHWARGRMEPWRRNDNTSLRLVRRAPRPTAPPPPCPGLQLPEGRCLQHQASVGQTACEAGWAPWTPANPVEGWWVTTALGRESSPAIGVRRVGGRWVDALGRTPAWAPDDVDRQPASTVTGTCTTLEAGAWRSMSCETIQQTLCVRDEAGP